LAIPPWLKRLGSEAKPLASIQCSGVWISVVYLASLSVSKASEQVRIWIIGGLVIGKEQQKYRWEGGGLAVVEAAVQHPHPEDQ